MKACIIPNLLSTTCFVACFGLTTAALSEIELVQISPSQPTSHDSITFTLAGGFPNSCWNVQSYDFGESLPRQFNANVHAVDAWEPGMLCLTVMVPYQYSETIGPLNPGTYSVHVTEFHQSLVDPWPNYASITFEVTVGLQRIHDLTVNVVGNDVVMNWSAVAGATGYKIYRRNDFELEFEFATFLDSTATPGYTDSNVIVLLGSTYFYNVTATR